MTQGGESCGAAAPAGQAAFGAPAEVSATTCATRSDAAAACAAVLVAAMHRARQSCALLTPLQCAGTRWLFREHARRCVVGALSGGCTCIL